MEAEREEGPPPLEIVPRSFVSSFLERNVWFCSFVLCLLCSFLFSFSFSFSSFVLMFFWGDDGEKEDGEPHSDGRTPRGFAEDCRMRTGDISCKMHRGNSGCHGPFGSHAAG